MKVILAFCTLVTVAAAFVAPVTMSRAQPRLSYTQFEASMPTILSAAGADVRSWSRSAHPIEMAAAPEVQYAFIAVMLLSVLHPLLPNVFEKRS